MNILFSKSFRGIFAVFLGGLALVGLIAGVTRTGLWKTKAAPAFSSRRVTQTNLQPTAIEQKEDADSNDNLSHGKILVWDQDGFRLLFAKIMTASTPGHTSGDLWVRDDTGRERFIAREVTSAKLAPDGNKVAYVTSEQELYIETFAGEFLARIPRASEVCWRSDSQALSFLAIAAPDYPEMQQLTVYDLASGHMAKAQNNRKTH